MAGLGNQFSDLSVSSFLLPGALAEARARVGGRDCSQVCNRSDQAGINYRSPHYLGGSEVRKFQFNTLQILK